MDPACKDLIDKLLKVKPEERLGARGQKHDMEMLKAHPFFKEIDFKSDLKLLKIKEKLFSTNLEEDFLSKINPKLEK